MFRLQRTSFCSRTMKRRQGKYVKEGMTTKPAATLTPTKLAAEAGISTDSLRFYERKGLLPAPPRTLGGRRIFPAAALQRVRAIRAALSLGFTVTELREIFRLRDSGGAPCQTVCQLASEKLVDLDQTIARLTATRHLLFSSIKTWRRKLTTGKPGARAGLLDLFAASNPESAHQLSPRLGPGLRQRLKHASEIPG